MIKTTPMIKTRQESINVKLTFRKDRFHLYVPRKFEGQRVRVKYDEANENLVFSFIKGGSADDGALLCSPHEKSKKVKATGFLFKHDLPRGFANYNSVCAEYTAKHFGGGEYLIHNFVSPPAKMSPLYKKSRKGIKVKRKPENRVPANQDVTIRELQDAVERINLARTLYGAEVDWTGKKYVLRLSA